MIKTFEGLKDLIVENYSKECPVCEGQGLETVEVARPQSFNRDVGEIYEELHHCENCDGSGEVSNHE